MHQDIGLGSGGWGTGSGINNQKLFESTSMLQCVSEVCPHATAKSACITYFMEVSSAALTGPNFRHRAAKHQWSVYSALQAAVF